MKICALLVGLGFLFCAAGCTEIKVARAAEGKKVQQKEKDKKEQDKKADKKKQAQKTAK
jgi:endogenous inhibitor of DNA gyrase (YacG/DUF329 family)